MCYKHCSVSTGKVAWNLSTVTGAQGWYLVGINEVFMLLPFGANCLTGQSLV